MPLLPSVAEFLGRAAVTELPDFSDAAASSAYLAQVRARRPLAGAREPVWRAEDRRVGRGAVPVRIYQTDAVGVLPAIIYFHGGGWVTGDLDMHDATCRALSRRCGAMVVNVDYRLAPEHPFPAPLDDCWDVLTWLYQTADELGVDTGRIGVAGSSSGGNLAAATAILARDRNGPPLAVQLLLYPALDPRMETASFQQLGTGHLLDRAEMAWFWRCYLTADDDRTNPYAAPSLSSDLTDLPHTVLVLPEYDPLRDEGLAYGDRLVAAGVPVDIVHAPGQIHGFIAFGGVFPDAESALARASALCAVRLCTRDGKVP